MVGRSGWANKSQVTGIRGGVVGGAEVCDLVGDRWGSEGNGADGDGQ
jgi:hypothetical protein